MTMRTMRTMRAREIEITAPRGQKTITAKALRDAGVAVRSDGTARWDPKRNRRGVAQPNADAVLALAKENLVKLHEVGSYRSTSGELRVLPSTREGKDPNGAYWRSRRAMREYHAAIRNMTEDSLASACVRARGHYAVDKGGEANPRYVRPEDAVEEILRRVGPAGSQALADEARYFDAYDRVQYESAKHSGRDWRGVSRAVVAADSSAAILAFVEAGTFLHKGSFGEEAGGLHHLRIAAYLLVRDATTGERHVLCIPPRFGSTRSATWGRYVDHEGRGDTSGLIHAAVAWTFALRPDEYQPDTET